MKRILSIALLAALWAGSALAQTAGTNTVSRNGYYFNSTTGQKTDADGNAYVNPVQNWTYYSRMFSDTLSTAGKNADSSGVYPVPNVKRRALLVYPLGVNAVTMTAMHVALEIRAHWQQSSDTSSTFAYARYSGANARWPTGVTAASDSIGHIGTTLPIVSTSSAAGAPSPSEVVLTVRTDVNQMLTKGFMIPIPDDFGPYLSIRLRVLDQLTPTGGAGMKRGRFDITLVGSPQ